MFVRPEQVAALVARFDTIARARVVADRDGQTDTMTVQVEGTGIDAGAVASAVQDILKLKGTVVVNPPGSLPRDGIVIEDKRTYDT
jgi:phenylacetate-CoA ligase